MGETLIFIGLTLFWLRVRKRGDKDQDRNLFI
jgi:cbb3-type cytochrome oxidase subunit 3